MHRTVQRITHLALQQSQRQGEENRPVWSDGDSLIWTFANVWVRDSRLANADLTISECAGQTESRLGQACFFLCERGIFALISPPPFDVILAELAERYIAQGVEVA